MKHQSQNIRSTKVAWVVPTRVATPIPVEGSGVNWTSQRNDRFLGGSRTKALSATRRPIRIPENKSVMKEIRDEVEASRFVELSDSEVPEDGLEEMLTNNQDSRGEYGMRDMEFSDTDDGNEPAKEWWRSDTFATPFPKIDWFYGTALSNPKKNNIRPPTFDPANHSHVIERPNHEISDVTTTWIFCVPIGIPTLLGSGSRPDETSNVCAHCQGRFSFFEYKLEESAFHERCKIKAFFHPKCNQERITMKELKRRLGVKIVKFFALQNEVLAKQLLLESLVMNRPRDTIQTHSAIPGKVSGRSRHRSFRQRQRSAGGKTRLDRIPSTPMSNPTGLQQGFQKRLSTLRTRGEVSAVLSEGGSMILPSDDMRYQRPLARDFSTVHRRESLHDRAAPYYHHESTDDLTLQKRKWSRQSSRAPRKSIVKKLFA